MTWASNSEEMRREGMRREDSSRRWADYAIRYWFGADFPDISDDQRAQICRLRESYAELAVIIRNSSDHGPDRKSAFHNLRHSFYDAVSAVVTRPGLQTPLAYNNDPHPNGYKFESPDE